MAFLWDKGKKLDARVLAFTAGEDHALDERLVRYDVLASIAHARMLAGRGLITQEDFKAIEEAIRGGVRRVHVISYDAPDSILTEVFTNEGLGTLIVNDINALSAAEQQSGKG